MVNIGYHYINEETGNTTFINMLFRQKLTRQTATKTALLARVLSCGTAKYPTKQAMAVALDELYGSIFECAVLKKGEEQMLRLFLEMPNMNVDLLEEGTAFLDEVIHNPLTNGSGFCDEVVEREKAALARFLKTKKDDKTAYAKERATEELCQGEPFGLCADGYAEDLPEITGQDLYDFYETFFREAPVEILVTGRGSADRLRERLLAMAPGAERELPVKQKENPRSENTAKLITEHLPVRQGKLCIGFRSDDSDLFSLLILNEIFGGGPSSRLFASLREAENLCYSVHSFLYLFKNILMVQAGISKEKRERAEALVLDTLKALETEITEEDLTVAKQNLTNHYKSLADSPLAMTDFYFTQFLLGLPTEISAFCEKLELVTAKEVKAAAAGLQHQLTYFLSEGGENA